tara:strand:+ start:12762 stop:13562 length:801 start_codon:yes stop_codon:yes gene_type:complete
MVDKKADDMTCSVLDSILPAARNVAGLFGLDRGQWKAPYVKIESHNNSYAIYRKVLPNKFARIDVIFVNGTSAGSLLFVEIADGIYHMVGMFINEEFRGKKISQTQNGRAFSCSVAFLFLDHVMNDLVEKGLSVTLEVMNYNKAAFKLYERWSSSSIGNHDINEFRLLTKAEVVRYGKLRRKPIKRWHDIGEGDNKRGVQWSHIPDYNGRSTYSISRVYYCEVTKPLSSVRKLAFFRNKIKLILSIIKYGRPVGFLIDYIRSKKKV